MNNKNGKTQQQHNKVICSGITINFNLKAVGLVGGEYESKPSVHTWCSFNPHRIIVSHKLDELESSNQSNIKQCIRNIHTINRNHKLNGHTYNWLFGNGYHTKEDEEEENYNLKAENEEEQEEK